MAEPAISVVIPTFNRSHLLERTLAALDGQIGLGPDVAAEVIVVDDGSTDDTAAIVAAHRGVRYVRQANAGPAAARNRGCALATGGVIAFTDDDTVPDRRWLADLVDAFAADPSLDAAGGTVRPLRLTFLTRFEQAEQHASHGVALDGSIKYLVTANCAYRRDVLAALGGFDETFPAASGEDTDLTARAHAAGYRIRLLDGAVVLHDHPTRLKPVLRTYLKHGRSRKLVVERNPGHGQREVVRLDHWRARYRRYRGEGLGRAEACAALALRVLGLLTYAAGMVQSRREGQRQRGLQVAVACPGADHVARGYERVSRELAAVLGTDASLRVSLVKGSGRAGDDVVLPCLRRDRPLAQAISRFLSPAGSRETEARRDGRSWSSVALRVLRRHVLVTPYDIEAATFGASLLLHCAVRRPDVLVIEDVLTARIVGLGRRLPRWRTRILFVNGAPWPPPYPFADVVQHLTPLTFDEDPADATRKVLLPLGTDVPPASTPAQAIAARRRFGLPEQGKVVVTLGTMLDWHKRHLHVVNELAKLPEPRPFLVLAGSPNVDQARIETAAGALLGDHHRVMHVAPTDVADLLVCADAFVLGSVREGFGLVYLEALAAGLPVVAHDGKLQRWLLESFGTYVDMTEPGALAHSLETVLAAGDRWTLQEARRRYITGRFAWAALRDQYVALVRRTAGGSG